MAEFHITREYPHRPETLWRALTDPDLVPQWTATGRGGRPEGFAAEVGRDFRYVGKPLPGWNGIVACEVLAVEPPVMLQHTWQGDKQEPSLVTWRIAARGHRAGRRVAAHLRPHRAARGGRVHHGHVRCWGRSGGGCSPRGCPRCWTPSTGRSGPGRRGGEGAQAASEQPGGRGHVGGHRGVHRGRGPAAVQVPGQRGEIHVPQPQQGGGRDPRLGVAGVPARPVRQQPGGQRDQAGRSRADRRAGPGSVSISSPNRRIEATAAAKSGCPASQEVSR